MTRRADRAPEAANLSSKEDSDVALQIMVPHRLKHALGVKAAAEGVTQRTLVLKALRGAGFEVADIDLHDRRKGRS